MGWISVDGQRVRGSAVVTDREALAAAVRGLGVNETARQVGVKPPTISLLINGGRSGCEVETAERIASAVGVPFDDFFSIRTSAPTALDVPSEDTSARRTA
jgi:plasmid maintenance system antidote protein VapI